MKPKRYPGSKPFTLAEKGIFFGREKDIEGLYNFICVEKLSVLYGKSGLGKTSLLNAGVIPKLQEENSLQILSHRFGSYHQGMEQLSPLESFDQCVRFEAEDSFLNQIESEDITLWQHLKNRELQQPEGEGVLIILDQFEELFTYPDGIEAFGEELARLMSGRMPTSFRQKLRENMESHPDWFTDEQWEFIKRPLRLKVLLSIRSDKMALLNRLAPFIPNILRDCYELMPLTRDQAESAIVKPAMADGDFASPCFSYEQTAIDKILDYLTQKGEKSVESFQLQILCQYVEENLVIQQADTSIAPEDLGDLESIYQNYYDFHIARLGSEDEQLAAKILIEEGLIFEKEERRLTLYEGQVLTSYRISSDLLKRLVDTHLIRAVPDSSGGYSYEISHDTLVGPILRSKARRKQEERQREAQRRAEEAERERELRQEKRRRLVFTVAGVVGFVILALLGLLGWVSSAKVAADSAKEEAQKAARSGALIIHSMQLQEDATVALRLAEKAWELALRNPDILDIIGQYYSENTFYKETYLHRQGVGAVAFSPENAHLLTGGDDFSLRLWDLRGNEVQVFRGHTGAIKSLAFSPGGEYVLSGSSDNTARLWRRNNGTLMQVLEGHEGPVYAVAFSPSGDTLLTASRDQTARLWTRDGTLIRTLEGHTDIILAAFFAPDGQRVYTASHDGSIKSWSVRSRSVRTFERVEAAINCMALSPKQDMLMAGTDDNRVVQWDPARGTIVREYMPHEADIAFIDFSPTGDSILTGSVDKTGLIWRLDEAESEGYRPLVSLKGHTAFIRAGDFATNGHYVLTASDDRSVKLWNLRHEQIDHFFLPPDSLEHLSFASQDALLLVGQPNGKVVVIDWARGDTLQALEGHRNAVTALKLHNREGNRYLVSGSADNSALLWQVGNRGNARKLASFVRHRAPVTAVDVFVDPKTTQTFVLTGSEDSTAILWNERAEILQVFSSHTGPITQVAFDPLGDRLLTASTDRTIKIWNRSTQDEEYSLLGHAKAVSDACFSSDGRYVLSGSEDKTAKLWDLNNGEEISNFKAHLGPITQVAFSPGKNAASSNEYAILTASEDHTAIQWSQRGRIMKKVDIHAAPVLAAGFSPDGEALLTVGQQGRVQVSYSLLASLEEGEIDTLSIVQQTKYGVIEDTSQIDYKALSREDLRAYAYWYMQKTDGSLTRDRLEYLERAASLMKKVLREPASPHGTRQDQYEIGLIYAEMVETYLFLNEPMLLDQLKSAMINIEMYAHENSDELRHRTIPYVYAGLLLRDSTEAANQFYELYLDMEEGVVGAIKAKVTLTRTLMRISDRLQSEDPTLDLSPIDRAIAAINEDILPEEGTLADAGGLPDEAGMILEESTAPEQSPEPVAVPRPAEDAAAAAPSPAAPQKRAPASSAGRSRRKSSSSMKLEWQEAGNYFTEVASKASNRKQQAMYLRSALKMYKRLSFDEAAEPLFDVYKELGYIYTETSDIDPLLDEALKKQEDPAFARRKGFILTDFSLFNAYLQTYQPQKARALMQKYPKKLVRDMEPAMFRYLEYWAENGGRSTVEEARGIMQELLGE